MIGTLALVGALLTSPTMDKVKFNHTYTAGQKETYTFDLKGDTSQGEMAFETGFDVVFSDKSEKGTPVAVKATKLNMNMGGQVMDRSSDTPELKFVLDEFGMPDSFNMEGEQAILTLPFLITYLPNKELEVGEEFKIDWKAGDITYKGSGKFEGTETVDGKTWPKLAVKAVLHPGEDHDGELTYSVYFDKDNGKVMLVKGAANIESEEFKFTLTKK